MGTNVRFRIVVMLLLIWALIFTALALGHVDIARFSGNRPFALAIAILGLGSLYPLYRFGSRWPQFRSGLIAMGACVVVVVCVAVASSGLGIEGIWIDRLFEMGQFLGFLATALLIFNGAKASHRH